MFLRDDNITFLPLPSSFNHLKVECWLSVTSDIQDWLTQVVIDTTTPEWQWGQDLFWMAFFASHPRYFHGDDTLWDSRIPFNGPIVQHFLDVEMGRAEGGHQSLDDIWIQFQNHVGLMYSSSISASSNGCPV